MASNQDDWVLPAGLNVIGSDGEKLGEVQDGLGETFTVKKGWLFSSEYTIPATAIASVDERAVYLNVTRDQALHQGWDQASAETSYAERTNVGAGYAGDSPRDPVLAATDDADTIRLPLSEEELTATRRAVNRGAVRIDKNVVEEEQSPEVPIIEEEVHVTRRTVDRATVPGKTLFTEDRIEIPIRGEVADVEKHAHVIEEMEISKQAVQRTEHVTGTVRREEAHVVDTTGTVTEEDKRDSTTAATPTGRRKRRR